MHSHRPVDRAGPDRSALTSYINLLYNDRMTTRPKAAWRVTLREPPPEVPGSPEEAVIADEAVREDRALSNPRLR
jgi:hypothetical protein